MTSTGKEGGRGGGREGKLPAVKGPCAEDEGWGPPWGVEEGGGARGGGGEVGLGGGGLKILFGSLLCPPWRWIP